MKITFVVSLIVACLFVVLPVRSQNPLDTKTKTVWLILKSRDILKGDLVKVTTDEVEFKVKGYLQIVPLDDVTSIHFTPPPPGYIEKLQSLSKPIPTPTPTPTPTLTPTLTFTPTPTSTSPVIPISNDSRPTILYREQAVYSPVARANKIQGTVVLSVVYTSDGRVTDIRVVRGLPYGLNDSAIEAAKKIRFSPAMKDGKFVSVRGNVEYNFALY